MHKVSCLLLLCLSATILAAQKTDSLHIFYRSDEFALSAQDQMLLDKFLSAQWDRIIIRSYADVTNEDEYNLELSQHRANEVQKYMLRRQVPGKIITVEYFGEHVLLANNDTEEGRAQNRRTSITGYLYPRIAPKPVVDPSKPVTETLNNGFIITYRPQDIPLELLEQFRGGTTFDVITNTQQMRNANLYNNTTDGEILSSVMIFSGGKYNPCKLDSPIFIKVPVPVTDCPADSIKFFAAVEDNGKRIWQEKAMPLTAETIDGQRYMGVWMDDFCGVYNFDYKIRPGCFDIDSMGLITGSGFRNLTSELIGLNSVYLPRRQDSLYNIWYVRRDAGKANVSFGLYNGKRLIKRFYNQPLWSLPYSEGEKKYLLDADTISFRTKRVKDLVMVLRVDRDVYRQFEMGGKLQFIYLRRATEQIHVDIFVTGKRKEQVEYRNVPIEAIPFDEATGQYRIDKAVLRALAEAKEKDQKQKQEAVTVFSSR